jgi:hypothetical protein
MKHIIRKKTVTVKAFINKGAVNNTVKVKVNFEEDQELRLVRLWGVQTFYRGEDLQQGDIAIPIVNGILPNDLDFGLPLISKESFQIAHLNLYDTKGVNFLKDAPFCIFQTIQNNWTKSGVPNTDQNPEADIVERDTKTFVGQHLDLQNSFIEFASIGFDGDAGFEFSIMIDFYYSRIDLDKNIVSKLKIN